MDNWQIRDVLTVGVIAISILSVILVSRNARRATAVNVQNTDLTRIRDLRSELRETREEVDTCRRQTTELVVHLTEANDRAIGYARREAEMLRFAHMPGVTIEDWLKRFDPDGAHEITSE